MELWRVDCVWDGDDDCDELVDHFWLYRHKWQAEQKLDQLELSNQPWLCDLYVEEPCLDQDTADVLCGRKLAPLTSIGQICIDHFGPKARAARRLAELKAARAG